MNETRPPHIEIQAHVRGMTPSPTVAINELSNELRKSGRRIYKLGLGQSPFPVPLPVVESLRLNAAQKDYLPVRGLLALREAVAEYHRRAQGIACTGDDVLIGPGSKELMFLLQVVFAGNLVIPTPAWVSYAPQARIAGREVLLVQARAQDNFLLRPDDLMALCRENRRPHILVLNYPSNPTGRTYSAGDLHALAEVAREHRVILLSDEIYGELHHKAEHVSVARYYPEGTIISGGLSKWCGAGGWRLGTFTFPAGMRPLLDAMAVVASETYTSTSAPIQHAAVRAFQGGAEIESYLWVARRILAALGQRLAQKLAAAGAEVLSPEGAFYLFPDFDKHRERLRARGIETSAALCERLLADTGVAALPGSVFGRPSEELSVRLAYVDFDGPKAMAAAQELGTQSIDQTFLAAHCGGLLEAVDRIGEWVAG